MACRAGEELSSQFTVPAIPLNFLNRTWTQFNLESVPIGTELQFHHDSKSSSSMMSCHCFVCQTYPHRLNPLLFNLFLKNMGMIGSVIGFEAQVMILQAVLCQMRIDRVPIWLEKVRWENEGVKTRFLTPRAIFSAKNGWKLKNGIVLESAVPELSK